MSTAPRRATGFPDALAACSGDGAFAAVARGPAIEILDLPSATVARVFPTGVSHLDALTVSEADGRRSVLGVSDAVWYAWDPATGAPLPADTASGGATRPAGVAFTLTVDGDLVRVADPAGGDEVGVLSGHTGGVDHVAVCSTGGQAYAVTAGIDRTVRVWQLPACTQVGVSAPAVVGLTAVAAGRIPATGGFQDAGGVGGLGGLDGDREISGVGGTGGLDGDDEHTGIGGGGGLDGGGSEWRTVLVAGDAEGRLHRRDAATSEPIGEPVQAHTGWVRAARVADVDGRPLLVTAGGETIRVWDLATLAPVGEPLPTRGWTEVLAVADWDGDPVVLWRSSDNRVSVMDLRTLRGIADGMADWSLTVAFARAGDRLLAVLEDHPEQDGDYDFEETALRVWDFEEGEPLGPPLPGGGFGGTVLRTPVTVLDTPTGPLLVSGAGVDGHLRIWPVSDPAPHSPPQPVGGPLPGHHGQITAVAALMTGGRAVAVTGGQDGTLRAWDAGTGTALGAPVPAHTATVAAVTLTEIDGAPVAFSAAADGTVHTWPLPRP